MLIQISHKIELKPNNKQVSYLKQACGVARFSYNWALAEWKKQYEHGAKPNAFDLKKEFNSIKKEQFPWITDVLKDANQQPFINLKNAFNRFFKKQGGYPKFKKKGIHDSFYISNDKLKIEGKKFWVPKLGWINLTELLRFEGKIICATISRTAHKWFVSITVKTILQDSFESQETAGVDLGIDKLAVVSNGKEFENPKAYRRLLKKLKRLHRSLSRKIKGFKNWNKTKLKLSKLYYRITCIRADSIHKLTTYLAQTFDKVTIEDLNVKGMVKNHKLAASILDASFGEIVRQIKYKAELYNCNVEQVDRFFPSSKLCSSCGSIKQDLKLSNRIYCCDNCGLKIDRDLNAAINLKNYTVGSTEF